MTQPLGRPRLVDVYVGRPQTYPWLGRELVSSIFKQPVEGPVRLLAENLEGDQQSDLKSHGGRDKALYVYAQEDVDWWSEQLDRPAEPSWFGENLRVAGIEIHSCVIGETWSVGSAIVQVTEPRTPCWKVGLRMGDPAFPRRFAASGRPGMLMRVLQQGVLQAGDPIEVLHRPAHGITVRRISEIYFGRDPDLEPMRQAPELAAHWQTWVEHRTVWHLNDERTKNIKIDAG